MRLAMAPLVPDDPWLVMHHGIGRLHPPTQRAVEALLVHHTIDRIVFELVQAGQEAAQTQSPVVR